MKLINRKVITMNKDNKVLIDSLKDVLYHWSNTDDKVDEILKKSNVGDLMVDIHDAIVALGGNPNNN